MFYMHQQPNSIEKERSTTSSSASTPNSVVSSASVTNAASSGVATGIKQALKFGKRVRESIRILSRVPESEMVSLQFNHFRGKLDS
jgi:hypothetical protein